MPASADSPQYDRSLAALLTASGGKPIIQIVLDPETDQTSIRSAGLDGGSIPRFLLHLGKALTGESVEHHRVPVPAYYLGRPASFWTSHLSPDRRDARGSNSAPPT